jgi:hypothetical protein
MVASLGRLELPLPKRPRRPTTMLDASFRCHALTSTIPGDDGRANEQRGCFGTGAPSASRRHWSRRSARCSESPTTSRWSPHASPTSLVVRCYSTTSSRTPTTSRWSPRALPTFVSHALLQHRFLSRACRSKHPVYGVIQTSNRGQSIPIYYSRFRYFSSFLKPLLLNFRSVTCCDLAWILLGILVLGHRRILQGHRLIHYTHDHLLIPVFPKFPYFLGLFDFLEIGVKPLIFLGILLGMG